MAAADPHGKPMLGDALEYLQLGYPIFPICSPAMGRHQHRVGGKVTDCLPAKHGKTPMIRWKDYQEELPSEAEVRSWWARWPTANIGMATGALSGVIVLDCDSGEARQLALDRGGLETAPAVWTGTPGGIHFWMAHPGYEVRNFVREIPGTDLRGDGGYVLLPPSKHARGATYRWNEHTLGKEPAPVPGWLADLFRERTAASEPGAWSGDAFDVDEALRGFDEGRRDDGLFRFACRLRHDDTPQAYAEALIAAAAQRCRPPFPVPEAVEKVRYVYGRYPPGGVGPSVVFDEEFQPQHPREPSPGSPEDRPQARVLVPLTAAELLLGDPLPVPWLIHTPIDEAGAISGGLLAEGDVSVIGAASGTGKTWLAAEVSFSLTTGLALFDSFTIARPCRVMVIDEESSTWLLRRRWLKILQGHGVTPDVFVDQFWDNLQIYVDQGFSFDNERALAGLYEAASVFRPDVVIFDTLARIHRRPENDNSEIAALFEDRIKPFRREFGCALKFMHHLRKPSKDAPNDPASMLRGAGDLKAQLDQFWFLRGRSGDAKAIFEHDKCRAMPEVKAFVIERIDTADGGVRILRIGDADAASGTAAEQDQDVLLTHLVDVVRATRQDLVDFGRGRAMGRPRVDQALKALLEADQIDRAKLGRETVYFVPELD